MSNGKSNEAVVLTMRKRYSSLRKASRPTDEALNMSRSDIDVGDPSMQNPWSDAPESPVTRRLHHRLSFDGASGVIILPEEPNWIMEDVDSDSEDESSRTPTPPAIRDAVHDADSSVAASTSRHTHAAPSPTKHRHGTYFHHPERRRHGHQSIPGAFPKI